MLVIVADTAKGGKYCIYCNLITAPSWARLVLVEKELIVITLLLLVQRQIVNN